MPQTIQTTLTANVKSKAKQVRKDGVDWLVVNGTLLVEGVHAGSSGPVLYRKDFLKKVADKWMKQPIVKDHPTNDEGRPVTANKGTFLKDAGMGHLEQPKGEPSLDAEFWFDSAKTKRVHPDTHNALLNGTAIEVSTGLELVVDETPGEWEGTKYALDAIDCTPDHLAIITNGEGACNVKKGCGVKFTANCGKTDCEVCEAEKKRQAEQKEAEGKVVPFTANTASYSRVMNAVSEAFYRDGKYNHYVRDVYPKFFIYRDGNGDLYQQSYTANSEGEVAISKDDPTPVKWITEYQTADGKFVGNASKETHVADKTKEHVDFLIANSNGDWTEGEREVLAKKPEAWLTRQVGFYKNPPKVEEVANKGVEKPTPKVEEVANKVDVLKPASENMTEEEWMAKAPPSIRAVLNKQINADKTEHERLVKALTANTSVPFTEVYLKGRSLDELQGLAKMAGIATQTTGGHNTPNYTGAALVQNAGGPPVEIKPLEQKKPDFSHRLAQNGKVVKK